MFNHQYDFDIEIPSEVITKEKHDHIFEELLENKIVLGLVGYSKSGKDSIAKKFVDEYGYYRIAFADNVKIQMNKHLKKIVFNYLTKALEDPNSHNDIKDGVWLKDGRELTFDMIDFKTEDTLVKSRLRPFIIWYAEKLRQINGKYFWINKALKADASGHNNIIISDVRRIEELDIFSNSNSFRKKSELGFVAAGFSSGTMEINLKKYSSLLFYTSQFTLKDQDLLTHDCIRFAQENWMFDYTFYIDSRLPEKGPYRNNSINLQVKDLVKKFGITKPNKKLNFPGRQTSILDL